MSKGREKRCSRLGSVLAPFADLGVALIQCGVHGFDVAGVEFLDRHLAEAAFRAVRVATICAVSGRTGRTAGVRVPPVMFADQACAWVALVAPVLSDGIYSGPGDADRDRGQACD